MVQAADVTKDRVIRFRADDKDYERLEALAEHFSAPMATVIRILVKEKYDALKGGEKSIFGPGQDLINKAVAKIFDTSRLEDPRKKKPARKPR